MIKTIHRLLWLIGLVLLQALVLNKVHLFSYATPFLYVYLILKIESGISRNALLLWAFCLGLLIDIFSDTAGMNAAATVLMAFTRPHFIHLFISRDMTESFVPSMQTMSVAGFIKYVLVGLIIHHAALVLLEYFSFATPLDLCIRFLSCLLLTGICVIALDRLIGK